MLKNNAHTYYHYSHPRRNSLRRVFRIRSTNCAHRSPYPQTNLMKLITIILAALAMTCYGGFSSPSTRSKSSSSKSSSSSSKSSSSKNGFSSGKSSSPSPAPSSNSKSLFDSSSARRSTLPPPKPKDEYIKDFRAKNAQKYTTTFDTQPATRPAYIPPTYNYGGKPRSVEYNPQTRSYGFFDDLGKFMVYDAITDIAMDSFRQDSNRYAASQSSNSGAGVGIFVILLVVVAVGGGAWYFMYKKS